MSEAAQILHLLRRGDVEQKTAAVQQAGHFVFERDYFPEAAPLLMELLEQDLNPKISEEAAWALWKFKDARAIPVLLRAAQENRHSSVREKAIRSLGLLEAVEALPFLRKLAAEKKGPLSLRVASIAALGYYRDADLISLLSTRLKDKYEEVRKEAFASLNRFFRRDPKSFPLKILKKMQRFESKKGFWRFLWPTKL